jgi:uncharacterized Fe-S center protein
MRLDKFLKVSRLIKRRTVANEVCDSARVFVNNNPAKPEMADIGIFASTDPVALDQACYDAIINSDDHGKHSLVNRMKEKHAIHLVEESERLGLGTREYEIVNID